jgi:rRNA-processing protein FCF1
LPDKENKEKPNIFSRREKYPNAFRVFSFQPKTLDMVKDNCLVVLDTNTLLLPYKTGSQSLRGIEAIYRQLIEQKRLYVPAHVAREFADQRSVKLQELFHQIQKKKEQYTNWRIEEYPLLEEDQTYQQLLELQQHLSPRIRSYENLFDDLLGRVKVWYWNDPVSAIYRSLFTGEVIVECKAGDDEIKSRIERCFNDKLPPGYKDSHKEDNQGGDVIIWLTIIELGREYQKDLIFVSGEEKADWVVRSAGRTLYPRYELIDEYAHSSGGGTFHLSHFADFLRLYQAPNEVVQEVRREESAFLATHSTLPNISNRIIRSWFDQVINPLLVALRQEHELLGELKWTWQVPPGNLSLVRPLSDIVYPSQDTLQQFLDFFPNILELFQRYEDEREQLLVACRNLQSLLEGSQELLDLVEEINGDTELMDDGRPLNQILKGYSMEENLKYLAQYIVNRSGEMQSHFSYAPIWNKYRSRFYQLLELPTIKPVEETLQGVGKQLLSTVGDLYQALQDLRKQLSIASGEPLFDSTGDYTRSSYL